MGGEAGDHLPSCLAGTYLQIFKIPKLMGFQSNKKITKLNNYEKIMLKLCLRYR